MIDREKLTGVVLGGLVTGLLISAIALIPKSRAAQIAEFFEEICISNHYAQPTESLAAWGFEAVKDTDGSPLWVHPFTATFLKLEPRRCGLDTLAPLALSETQARELLRLLEAIVKRRFPELTYDPNAQMGSVHKGGAKGPPAHPSRWGVFFFAYPDWQESAGSTLFLVAPQGEPL
ncbi:hypothetical protein [uncultured Shimia sp.]|uniref:hypothetical protein n=1 Tax=uncultured Shimia sp. TaxID=573152 RepID=UPI0026197CFD|nr:hypothetical protein [uncultured Shimia sp.]